MSNKGLRIELPLKHHGKDLWMGALECLVAPEYKKRLGVYLKRLPHKDHQYVRVRAHRHHQSIAGCEPQTIYVRQTPSKSGVSGHISVPHIAASQ